MAAVIVFPIGAAKADGLWSVSEKTLDFGSTTWTPGRTTPPTLQFTITNSDPKNYLLVEITQTTDERTSQIRYERKPVNDQAICTTLIGSGGSCTQNVIFSPTTLGHHTATFLISGSLQGAPATTETLTIDGDSVAIGATPTPKSSATPKPTSTKPAKIKADLVVGFLNPTLAFKNGAFGKYIQITQRVLIKNHGPYPSEGGTLVFHFPDDSLAAETPNGDAVNVCKVTRIVEDKTFGHLIFDVGQCTLEPIPVGQTHELSVTYEINWHFVTETATVHVVGKHDPSPDTSAQRIDIERPGAFSSSRVLKLGTDYKLEGSKTSNNPALK